MSGSENSEFGIGSSDYSRTKNTNNTYNYGSNSIGNNNNYDDDLGGYQPSVGGSMKNKPRVVVNQNPYTINNPILSQNKISYQPSILENNGLKQPMRPSNSALDN
jgi:hypothetical protein